MSVIFRVVLECYRFLYTRCFWRGGEKREGLVELGRYNKLCVIKMVNKNINRMNKLNFTFLIAILITPLILNAKVDSYVIKGNLYNYDSLDLVHNTISAIKVLPNGQRKETVNVNENGEFTISGDKLKDFNQVWLQVGDLYYGELLVSKELIIELDVSELRNIGVYFYGEGVKFSGIDGTVNKMVNKWILYEDNEIPNFGHKINNIPSYKTQKEKIHHLDSLFNELEFIEHKFIEENPLFPSWILLEKRLSSYYSQLFSIVHHHDYDFNYINEGIKFTPKILANSSYNYYRALGYFLKKSFKTRSFEERLSNMKSNSNNLKQYPENLDFTILSSLPDDILDWERYVEEIVPEISQSWIKEYLLDKISDNLYKVDYINSKLSEPIFADTSILSNSEHTKFEFGARLYVIDDKSIKPLTLIKAIQDHIKNKAIVMDLWATWCLPCIQDMKESKSTKARLDQLPLEFVYICTNDMSNVETWENQIMETESKGIHIFIENELANSLLETFNKVGYPSYLLFDKNNKYHPNIIHRISLINLKEIGKYID